MEQKSFNKQDSITLKDPEKILHSSRKEIDQIDSEIIDLIQRRTSLAKDIVLSKLALDMDIFDESREKLIYEKLEKLANDKNLTQNTKNSVFQIMDILINLSKKEQEEIIIDN
ncbi:chorismate mutase [Methanobrevibacter sp. TMH8]|uniref:chorismate mutase n=1 Tax=Methanobrevibacter sp. TMH8 TaxID=2848611 RepID=UPI001CCD5C9A|nr:chorismate mutase [Methanobrevibacter sp. TMH8]MBZ9571153.1 chorismate mutase [Methanobrevibacter sp. TMH8]